MKDEQLLLFSQEQLEELYGYFSMPDNVKLKILKDIYGVDISKIPVGSKFNPVFYSYGVNVYY